MPSNNTLQCVDLQFAYPRSKDRRPALRDLEFGVIGPAVAVLGPNGAGKSTLFKVLSGVLRPSSGLFSVGEVIVRTRKDLEALRQTIAVLPQGFEPPNGFTCSEFLAYVAWMRKVPTREIPSRVDNCLRIADLEDRADHRIKSLSGGMKQRLGIAQTFVSNPSLVLLDEPTVGLDPEQRRNFLSAAAQRRDGSTITLLATHQIEDVADFADEVVVLQHGTVAFNGSLQQFCGSPRGLAQSKDVERAYLDVVRGTATR